MGYASYLENFRKKGDELQRALTALRAEHLGTPRSNPGALAILDRAAKYVRELRNLLDLATDPAVNPTFDLSQAREDSQRAMLAQRQAEAIVRQLESRNRELNAEVQRLKETAKELRGERNQLPFEVGTIAASSGRGVFESVTYLTRIS
jgi:septal ring factor EnvC (AmiA/AmiB activator)